MTDKPVPRRDDARGRQEVTAKPVVARPVSADGRPLASAVTGAPRGRRRPRPTSWLTIAGYGALGLGCLLAATVTFLLVAAPVDLVRDRVVEVVKARTGRDLVISGPTSLSLFPRFGVAFSQVSLTAPEDMGGPPTLAAQTLAVELPLWSLLSRQIVVRRIQLDRPAIELRIDAQGRRSWAFAAIHDRPTRLAQAGNRTDDAQPDGSSNDSRRARPRSARAGLGQLMAASVRILDGRVRYVDERSGTSHDVGGLDAELAIDEAGSVLDAKGGLNWTGQKLSFEGKVSPVRAMLEGEQARFALRVAGPPFEAAFEGSAGIAGEPAFDGTINIRVASSAALTQWLARHRAGAAEAGPLTLSSKVAAAGRSVAFSELSATLGDSSLSGSLTVETGGIRPHVRGDLQLSELDFGRLLVRPGRSEPAATEGEASPDQIGDLLQPRGAEPGKARQARGAPKQPGGKGWSDEIIDLAPLGLADADIALSVERLVYKNASTGRSRLALALKDRVARITLEDMQLYEGRGRGVLTLDGRGQAAVTGVNLTLDGVSALPLLRDALDFGWLDARGTIALAVAGQGLSERQIVETLHGKVELSARNGAIVGVDIAKLLGGIERGRFSAFKMAPEDRTPFSELGGSFVIANGVAQNQDLRLVSPLLRISGAGSTNLALRQVDYIVRPKIAASLAGEGAIVNLTGLEIPVRIEGPWERPTFTPDLKSVVGSEQTGETLKQIGKNLKSQEVQGAIRDLLGGGDGQQKVKPRDLLQKLLKKD